jgi:hypothetical protein
MVHSATGLWSSFVAEEGVEVYTTEQVHLIHFRKKKSAPDSRCHFHVILTLCLEKINIFSKSSQLFQCFLLFFS